MNNSYTTHLYNNNILTYIDIHFGSFMNKLSKNEDTGLFLAAALVSNAAGNGDVCLDLESFAEKVILEEDEGKKPVVCPSLKDWLKILGAADVVGKPGDYRPLILDDKNRLYFYRFWNYEKILSEAVKKRAGDNIEDIDIELIKNSLIRLFPDNPEEKLNLQKIAALTSVFKRFCVISGGPGTGKTTTIAKILTLLIEIEHGKKLKIFLSAPTGKAAAKLSEAILSTKKNIDCSDGIKSMLPEDAYTIHRMLRVVPGTSGFYYNADNKLPADVVVVDEASMVDLALLVRLVEAVPDKARLILVGDKDQLASVEAGSVLGDICNRGKIPGYSVKLHNKLVDGGGLKEDAEVPGKQVLSDSLVVLQRNYRFSERSGIGRLSSAVNNGDADTAMSIMKKITDERIHWEDIKTSKELYSSLEKKIVEGYTAYQAIDDPTEALNSFSRFKILCAVNKGQFGVDAVNSLAESVLAQKRLINPSALWYRGRPVLIKGNNYSLGLYNGDIGIIMADRDSDDDDVYAFFHGPSAGKARKFKPGILPDHDTAYAMTIHKSQGSEFEEVVLVLPEKDSPVLSRELIYTGLTRTTGKITLLGTEDVIRAAISRKTERASGLRDALWED
ncbi:MAG: exodeoxyribonuclease V subunit alpha [Proteobacteria bacterium]|nr:exodeoxyribonuclease V subunit alpha [Pseudomonadota bacterium]MBU1712051.1 exodeoxyribonuclease V subunit alpha [Pseudomonadota bacterium]